MMGQARVVLTAAALGWTAVIPSAQERPAAGAFTECRMAVARAMDDYDAAYCFFDAARASGAWIDALRALDALSQAHPSNAWLPLVTGHVHRYRQPSPDMAAAEAAYTRSARAFASRRHAEGEILALTNLRDMLMPLGRVAEASAHVARVADLGRTETDPLLQARVWLLEATHTRDTGGDLGHAYRLLRQTERALVPDGPYRLRRTTLLSLGTVAFQLGRLEEALDVFTRLDAAAAAEPDGATQAMARFQRLNTRLLGEELLPSVDARASLVTLARESLAMAEASRSDRVALYAHRILADLLAHSTDRADQAVDHAERCLAMARATGERSIEAACAWRLAFLVHARSSGRALDLRQRAHRASEQANSPVADAINAGHHMRFAWLTAPPGAAVEDSLKALDALETLRALQQTAASSAESFATWTADYYWLAGRLMQLGDDANLARAFSVVERLRARTLLEARDRTRVPLDADSPVQTEREAILRELSGVQRLAMFGPSVAGSNRPHVRVADLESRLADLDRQLNGRRADRQSSAAFADLASVQASLAPNEAMLSYQLGLWEAYDGSFGGGAWLTAVTARERRVYRLPDRVHFASAVPIFSGLLSGDSGADAVPAARLWRDTFATALHDLPASVTRLVIVPDGPLHTMPFDALRESATSPPVAARYELDLTPSATLWLATRRATSPRARALVLADPALPGASTSASSTRQAWLDRGVALGPLPHTRRESRAALRRIEGVDTLEGATASEHALKTRDLSSYGVLHVAAHAIADESEPGRSAVVLAAGGDAEDGLLQPREIAELALDGKVVILSACQTASGVVLGGEGVMSLARAFFEAGARTVIGTRWPVADEGTAQFFEMVYEALGEGLTVSAALGRAKQRAIDAGMPSSVWAGVVLLGDGAIAPLAPRRQRGMSMVATGVGVVGLGAAALAMRRRSRRLVRHLRA